MNYFISIVGTTSTGKTDYAFTLANEFLLKGKVAGVVLLSADSRQVYKGLDVLSGADIPATFVRKSTVKLKYSFFEHREKPLFLHGQSIINPDEDWSVAHFKKMADEMIIWCDQKKYLLFVVGGTGLYQSQLLAQDPAVFVGPNDDIRNKSITMSVTELQDWLQKIDTGAFETMNNSDRNNPRRLVRALEKTTYLATLAPNVYTSPFSEKKQITIGLQRDFVAIQNSIKLRIEQRIKDGAIKEVTDIIARNTKDIPATSTIGFLELKQYLEGLISLEDCIETWFIKESQYAKRQITWWKTHPPLVWLNSENLDYEKEYAVLIDQYVN